MDPIGDDLLSTIKPEIGYREGSGQHSKFGEWYAVNVAQDPQYKTAPWCAMFIAWAAEKAGVQEYVGQFAWTPSQARWFETNDAWTRTPEPGALVFFDWSGGKDIRGIDHVGVVESVNGGTIHTIEGNVDRVWLKRKTRDQSKVVGYGLPRKVKEKLTAVPGKDDTVPQAAGRIEVRPALAPGATTPAGTPGTLPVSMETAAIAGLLTFILGATFVLSRLRPRSPRVSAGRHRRRNGRRERADLWTGMTYPVAETLPRAETPPAWKALPQALPSDPGGPDRPTPRMRETLRVSRPSWACEPYRAGLPKPAGGAGTRTAGTDLGVKARRAAPETREGEEARAA
ncbi:MULTISPECIES: CHAP domain-containing protein [unclassified Streptosporangium]|uniref:CHAP domain-containing protein n=1 Tax=unclassified Streptosporangium TaxID=2632669 RepID=UPI002E2BBC77|nr:MULTISPECIES: CHAP domain-containing protein [unclassified Streptosporangium]